MYEPEMFGDGEDAVASCLIAKPATAERVMMRFPQPFRSQLIFDLCALQLGTIRVLPVTMLFDRHDEVRWEGFALLKDENVVFGWSN